MFSTLTSIYTVISNGKDILAGRRNVWEPLYAKVRETNIYDVLERKMGKLEEAEKLKRIRSQKY